MNTAAKGRRNEKRTQNFMEHLGYSTISSRASKGPWDVVAWNDKDIYFIQVKTNEWVHGPELARLVEQKIPPNGRKIVHRWDTGKHLPSVMTL